MMIKKITFISLLILGNCAFSQDSVNSCSEIGSSILAAGSFSISAVDGTEIPAPVCASGGNNASSGEWYAYQPSADYYVTISSDLTQNSGLDTRVHVYSGSCGALNCIVGDDDGGSGYLTLASFYATAGITYYIAWDNNWSGSGFDWELIEGDPPPVPPFSFTTTNVGINGTHRAAVDMNNDQLDDLVSINTESISIYYQLAEGGFNAVSIPTTPADFTPSWSLAAGDFDHNGYNYLLYGGGSGVTFMKANADGSAFEEISGSEYVFSQRSNFVDINNDGHLDAFVCHDVEPNVYYINDGLGNLNFFQGPSPDGVPSGIGNHPSGGHYGTVWIDYDNDHDIDLFIAKCRGGSGTEKINELWRNDSNGSFTEVGGDQGVNMGDEVQTWSSAWGDFDNDGDMDAYIGASSTANGTHKLMRNNGDGTFDDIFPTTGITNAPLGIENAPADFDNDGFVDVLSNGSIMLNNQQGGFEVYSVGAPPSGAIGDLNNDGFLDVFNGSVYFNNGNSNNWVKIHTVGIESNSNGIGARVEVTTPTLGTQIRDVRSGEGFRYMSTLTTHFGLGVDTTISEVTIYWPSGIVDVFSNLEVGQTHVIEEGSSLGLENYSFDNFMVYPNPASSYLNFDWDGHPALYAIYDVTGKKIIQTTLKEARVSVSNLAVGKYIFQLKQNGQTKTQSFIKQ